MKKVSQEQALDLGKILRLSWQRYDFSEFRRGLEVEQEHLKTIRSYARPHVNEMIAVAMTVVDHLDENPKYYTLLDKAGL